MAVDYYHHIVVSGRRTAVADFVSRIAMVAIRHVAGETWNDTVPFSLESLYRITKIEDDFPGEPFDMTRWRIVPRANGRAEIRYRFHTRNVEMHPLLKKLSRVLPKLKFALVTLCLDDSDFGAFTIQAGQMRGKWLGDEWRLPFWQTAARLSQMEVDEAYEDDEVTAIAESLMLHAAVKIATGSKRTYNWSGGRIYRDFDEEQANAILALAAALEADKESSAPKRRRARKRVKR